MRHLILLWLLGSLATASAHDVPLSSVLLDIGHQRIVAELQLPLSELGLALQLPLAARPDSAVAEHAARIDRYVGQHFWIRDQQGRNFVLGIEGLEIRHSHNANWLSNDWLIVRARLDLPAGASSSRFVLHDSVIVDRVVSHQSLVYVRRDLRNGLLGEQPMLVGELGFGRTQLAIDGSGGSWFRGFANLYAMGMKHIAEGSDHLLFLLTLLLPAPLLAAGGRWRSAKAPGASIRTIIGVVSGFTLGHSLTLALAAMGKVTVPTPLVEIAIAISILVSSAHAIRPLFPGRELWLAMGFGLVHGLAFAATLSGLDFDGYTLAISLLGFNLGIESMQLLVIGATLPLMIALAATAWYPLLRVGGAIFAAVCALGWILERALHIPNPLQPLVNWLAAPPGWLIATVCAASALTMIGLIGRRLGPPGRGVAT